jgi:hypothetical protein
MPGCDAPLCRKILAEFNLYKSIVYIHLKELRLDPTREDHRAATRPDVRCRSWAILAMPLPLLRFKLQAKLRGPVNLE